MTVPFRDVQVAGAVEAEANWDIKRGVGSRPAIPAISLRAIADKGGDQPGDCGNLADAAVARVCDVNVPC